MRENRTYGSEGGEPVMDNSPTPINTICDIPSLTQHYLWICSIRLNSKFNNCLGGSLCFASDDSEFGFPTRNNTHFATFNA